MERNSRKSYTYALVKPSGPDCNLACTYCFYYHKQDYFAPGVHRMSDAVLETLIQKSLSGPERQFGFGWQGGEPTLMGLEFYQRAIELQKKYGAGKNISNSMQTNGILINEEWADFFIKYHFLVGLSIDGPAHVHDHYRVTASGKGTHEEVEKTARMLLNKKVEVNALSVVTDYSAKYPEETYRYLRDLGFTYLQFIPVVETNPENSREAAPYSVTAKAYGEFLCRIFDLWEADFRDGYATISVRLFDTFSHIYMGMQAPECTVRKTCGDYLVVEHNGDIFSCDFFVEDAWHLGNILEDDPREIINSRRQELFGKMKSQLAPKCLKCEWLAFCWGGCIKDRVRDPRDKRFNHFCEAYKIFFSYADQRFRKLMENFRDRQAREAQQYRTAQQTSRQPDQGS
ncbi:MAG: anaerobic sulfatase maturase [Spirochaetia bacterium]|nr:anaerobic sulfatase maturase [Spirochaetia bacterium]